MNSSTVSVHLKNAEYRNLRSQHVTLFQNEMHSWPKWTPRHINARSTWCGNFTETKYIKERSQHAKKHKMAVLAILNQQITCFYSHATCIHNSLSELKINLIVDKLTLDSSDEHRWLDWTGRGKQRLQASCNQSGAGPRLWRCTISEGGFADLEWRCSNSNAGLR